MYNSGRRGKRAPDGYGVISTNDKFYQTSYPIPIIDSWSITDGSYNPIDDTALNTAGGQTVVLYGSGFASGATVNINGSNIGIVTVLDPNRITFTSPALSSASYNIYVSNPNGATAIYVPGLVYSGLPNWSSPPSDTIGTSYETKSVSTLNYTTFTATGDATITYSIISGNLPSGVTLSSSGELSGTLPATSSPTTYSFTIRASDGQNQDSDRAFSLTINPDAVTWVAPTLNGSLSVYETQSFSTPLSATSAAGYGVMYSADTLPTGITLNPSTGALDGYANTVGNTNAQLTATANTTGRYTTSNVTFTVNQDVVTWSSPTNNTEYALSQGVAMSGVTLSASSAAGYGVQYTANALPTGVTLSGDTISGTPTVSETVYTQLTATANTTNRTATRFISWTVSVAGDQYFKYNTLLLSANSSIQTPSYVYDNSINNAQISVFGDTRATNFNPYQHGYYSVYVNGTTDFINTSTSTAYNIGTKDYCLEGWALFDKSFGTAAAFISNFYQQFSGDYGIYLGINATGYPETILKNGNNTGQTLTLTGTTKIEIGAWTHYAVVRTGVTLSLFVNGMRVATSDLAGVIQPSHNIVTIGKYSSNYSANWWSGYISNAQMTVGTTPYSATSTTINVPTSPLNVTTGTVFLSSKTRNFIDESPLQSALTLSGTPKITSVHPFSTVYQAGTQYYSTKFDGTGDYLTTPSSNNFDMGTGDFTIECFVVTNGYAGSQYGRGLFALYPSGNYNKRIIVRHTNVDNRLGIYGYDGTNTYFGSSGTGGSYFLIPGTWNHVAFVRQSGVFRLYINGVQDIVVSNQTAITLATSNCFDIGRVQEGSVPEWNGIISNFRVIKGTCLYPGGTTFTPPTNTLSAVSGTSLLTCQDSTFKDNSTNNFTITANGNAVPVAVSPFTPSSYTNTEITTYGSGYFDGTGDYITIPDSPALKPISVNFTLECWVYFTATATNKVIATFGQETTSGSATATMQLKVNSSNQFEFVSTNYVVTIDQTLSSGITANLNTWYHLAVVRSVGQNFKFFVDGILKATSTDYSFNRVTGPYHTIGAQYRSSAYNDLMTGYISDLRLVSNAALYTSNFVPQFTSKLTNVTNTQLLTLQTNGSHNNSTFKDSSSFNNVITRAGNATNGTFSPYGDSWSINFNRSRVDANLTGKAPGTGSHTYEFFFYVSVKDAAIANQAALLSTRSGGSGADGIDMVVLTDGSIRIGTSGTTFLTTSAGIVKDNTWYHLALVRNGTTSYTLYLDGSSVGTFNNSTNLTSTELYLGVYGGATNDWFKGYISNFRYTRAAVYTSNFAAPTSPLNVIANTEYLVGSTNRFIDLSPNNFTVTRTALNGSTSIQNFSPFGPVIVSKYYSTYFDGTGDYLSLTNSSAFDFGSGDLTVECWFMLMGDSPANPDGNRVTTLFTTLPASGTLTNDWSFGIGGNASTTGTTVSFNARQNGTNQIVSYAATITKGVWHHLVVTKTGNTASLYYDGVRVAQNTNFTNQVNSNGTGLKIGSSNYGTFLQPLNGYISNIRLVKGSVLYTGETYSVPTSPLTAVSGTSLLTCQDSLIKDNSTNNFTITGNGDARPLPISPFTPTTTTISYSPQVFGSSMYFDGTGDYLTAPNTNSFDLSRGAWTIECWFYQLAAKQVQLFSVGAARWRLDVGTNGSAGFVFNSTSVATYPSGSFPPGQWNHIAATFMNDGTTIQQKSYANGKLVALGQYGPSADTTSVFYVGRNPDASGTWDFNGYMTDVLITKGESLYGQSSFYPRTSPTQVTANTAFLLNGTTASVLDATRTTDLDTVADTKVTNFSPYNGSYYSNYFDGTGDYLSIPNNIAFDFGTSDFTIEGWFMLTGDAAANGDGTRDAALFSFFPPNGGSLYNDYNLSLVGNTTTTGTGIGFGSRYNNSTPKSVNYIGTISKNVWHHFAFCKTGTTGSMYYDGNRVAQGTVYSDVNSGGYEGRIGSLSTFGSNNYLSYFPGYISNIRVVKGSQVYTGTTYTVPTSPLTAVSGTSLLTCQSNKFVDNSTNNHTITRNGDTKVVTQNPFQVNTGQSYYFDGTGDYIANNTGAVNLVEDKYILQKDFTIEGWIYPSSTNIVIFCLGNETTNRFIFFLSSGNQLAYDIYLVGTTYFTPTIQQNCWTHVALTRSGSTITCYINGVSVGTGTTSSVLGNGPLSIGTNGSRNGAYWSGYLSDLRITKGVARTITVPSAPLILK